MAESTSNAFIKSPLYSQFCATLVAFIAVAKNAKEREPFLDSSAERDARYRFHESFASFIEYIHTEYDRTIESLAHQAVRYQLAVEKQQRLGAEFKVPPNVMAPDFDVSRFKVIIEDREDARSFVDKVMDEDVDDKWPRIVFFTDGSARHDVMLSGAGITYTIRDGRPSPWADSSIAITGDGGSIIAELVGVNSAIGIAIKEATSFCQPPLNDNLARRAVNWYLDTYGTPKPETKYGIFKAPKAITGAPRKRKRKATEMERDGDDKVQEESYMHQSTINQRTIKKLKKSLEKSLSVDHASPAPFEDISNPSGPTQEEQTRKE
ncbi:hypothetical protein F5B20DRAFT_597255 [Whalleya microplaca]|nr:hypothetical protein F5B20DRAFT_597255 [Whalleya microplaca]